MEQTDFNRFYFPPEYIEMFQYGFRKLHGTLFCVFVWS